MNFTAIDFETATSHRGSACSVGLVVVENGQITQKVHQLIQPPGNRYDRFNISIHGITPAMTQSAPPFSEVWKELSLFLSQQSVIAHNASFDMSVLRYCLDHTDMEYPTLSYYCTYLLSKSLWPERKSYVLSDLSTSFGIEFEHHRADEDAYACARIALAMLEQEGVRSLDELARKNGFQPGLHHPGGYSAFSKIKAPKTPKRQTKAAKLIAAALDAKEG
ncbi:3'-5' exonuclease [Gorillibacterium timonense]|uniref:3'-5' exonuclease n=1 Tax=Gorillibacterium timonense TaxID=1689269 RepID=UPI00071E5114|nr:3'-5' exonuclease [Gorillibacterium timonense]